MSELDAQGRVVNQTVWLRPWPVVTILRDSAIAGQLPSLPADYWHGACSGEAFANQPARDTAGTAGTSLPAAPANGSHAEREADRYRQRPRLLPASRVSRYLEIRTGR